MKRTLLFLATIIFASISLFAGPRSEQQALDAASEFLTGHSHVLRAPAKDSRLTHSWTALQTSGQPAFYVFNRGENDGFVIVSAEDRTYTILSYGDTGHFDEAQMPDNMRSWLGGYARTIEQVAAMPENPAARLYAPRRKPAKATGLYTPVAPFCTTQWNQGTPYNNLCPSDIGGRCVTGCVATAAAQVMKKYNYPEHGTGTHSYSWKDVSGNVKTLSANFASTTYQWSQMIDNYQATSSTAEQKTAVATLMYHCGVACEMGYASGSSLASSNKMLNAMVNFFGYDAEVSTLLLDYIGEEAFVRAIAADLALGHPVLFSGRTVKDEGHAFVCDGINADGLVHINWGWGGLGDNYYRVSVLHPEDQGTGGSIGNYAFTENVTAYIGIQPDNGGTPVYSITGSELQFESLTFSRSERMFFQINEFCNQSISAWEGQMGYQLYQNGLLLKTQLKSETLALNPEWYYYYTNMYDDWSSLQDGEYEFVPVFTTSGSEEVTPVLIRGFGEYRCTVSVSGDDISITLPTAPETVDISANEDPLNAGVYYTTFYHSTQRYRLPGNGTEAYVADLSGGELLLTRIAQANQVLPNNVAVIFRAPASTITLTETSAAGVSFSAENDLRGVDAVTPLEDLGLTHTTCYVLSGNSTDGVGFYQCNSDNLKAHKAYLPYAGGPIGAPRRMRFVYDSPTDAEQIQSDNVQSTKVIRDGQLIIIRNGVEYNAAGQIVK